MPKSPSPTREPAGLGTVPWDIVAYIANGLDSRSLTRLGRVSRDFKRFVDTTRSIWLTQADSLAREHCLPPSFPERTSLPLHALRAFATRPYQFISAMEKRHQSLNNLTLTPRVTRHLPHAASDSDDEYGGTLFLPLQAYVLIPGARWLVTAHSDEEIGYTELSCWDLDSKDISSTHSTYRLPKALAIHEDLSTSPVLIAQADPDHNRVILLVRTWDYDMRYDLNIIFLTWPGHDATSATPPFHQGPKLDPGNVLIDQMTLESTYVCLFGLGNGIIWNWEDDTLTRFNLADDKESETVCIAIRPPHLIAVSKNGHFLVYDMPELLPCPAFYEERTSSPAPLTPLSTSESYGTVRTCGVLDMWRPLAYRQPVIVCKTTLVIATRVPDRTVFANPVQLFDYSNNPSQSHPCSTDENPSSKVHLPHLMYRGRGSLDWMPTYELTCGVLVEQTVGHQRGWQSRIRSDMHIISQQWDSKLVERRMQNPLRGEIVLAGDQGKYMDRSWVQACHVSGRVVAIDPEKRTVDVFEMKAEGDDE